MTDYTDTNHFVIAIVGADGRLTMPPRTVDAMPYDMRFELEAAAASAVSDSFAAGGLPHSVYYYPDDDSFGSWDSCASHNDVIELASTYDAMGVMGFGEFSRFDLPDLTAGLVRIAAANLAGRVSA